MAALAIFAAEVIWTVTPADAFVTKLQPSQSWLSQQSG